MAQNQVYLIKSGENSFVEETQAIVGISGGKVGIGTTHPEADLHVSGDAQVDGNLTVKGNLTTVDATTIQVDDKNIELGVGSTTDAAADGGGITLHGATNKTFNWVDATDAWTSSENLSVADGKHFAGDELRALDADGLSLFDNNQSGITIKGGKVGVHQTDPVYDLDVDGSGNFTSLYVDGNSVLTGEGSVFGKWEDGATAGEIFYTGGNVGVGTINPEHNFHVVGNSVVGGNFIVNGTSGTFNVDEFDVSGSNITLNSAGGGLDSNRGGLIVNGDDGTGKLEYLDLTQTWQSNQDIQIVADKHLQTDKVRAIEAGGLYLQDDGGNGIHIQDGGNVDIDKQLNIAGLTKANGGLNVGNGKFEVSSDGSIGDRIPDTNDVIKWNGAGWIAATSPGGGGSASSEVPLALSRFLDSGQSIHAIDFDDAPVGGYDNVPSVATDLEIVGEGSIIPYAISGLSNTGYYAVFSQDIPTENTYKLHTTFGGREVYWRTGEGGTSIYYDGDDVSIDNLTVGGNLTVNGTQTIVNTETLEIKDHNIVIASNTGYNQLTAEYPSVGDAYAGILWGTGDAGAASPVSLTYQSNKGFAFEGGNVGIGTTTPSSFHGAANNLVVGSGVGSEGLTIYSANNSYGSLYFADGTTGPEQYAGWVDYNHNTNFMRIATNGSEAVRIDEDGNVDLYQGKNLTWRYAAGSTIRGSMSIDSADNITFSNGSSNTERMLIDTSGNVGIGTTNPTGILHLEGDSPVLKIRSTDNWTATTGPVISFQGKNSAGNTKHFAGIKAYSAGVELGELAFNVRKSNTKREHEAMRIDSDGNVGIGATSPGGKLHVTDLSVSIGTVDVTNTGTDVTGGTSLNTKISNGDRIKINDQIFTVSNVQETTLILSGTPTSAGNFLAYTDNNALVVTSAGNVGIGTTNPRSRLDIIGKQPYLQSASDLVTSVSKSALAVQGASDAGAGLFVGVETSDARVYLQGSNGNGSATVDLLLQPFNGNVGIGTTNPAFSSSGSGLVINGTTPALSIQNNLGSSASFDFLKSGLDTYIINRSNGPLRLYTNNTEAVRIDSDGNVGIGTTDPGAKLEVDYTAATQVGLTLNGSNSALNNAIKLTDASDNAITLSINAGKFGINGGNVGIGTTDPDGELHVNDGDSASQIFITSSDNSVAGLYLGDQTRGFRGGVIYNNSTDSLGLWGYAATGFTAQRMIIDSDGNVGIGTANPGSYKLNVNGTASVVHSSSGSQEVTSDDRVKHNEQPIVGALETLSKVTPKKYIKTTEMYDVDHDFELDADGNPVDENGEPVEHRVEAGVIAQQVLTVDELAFAVSPEGVDEDGTVTSPHGLDYNSLFTYAIAAIQEQQQLIDDLKSQNESLATRISALES